MTNSEHQPDSTDLEIISVLRANPRTTNKDIAKRLDLAETTVAQRIRSMADREVMRVIAQQHVFSNGFTIMCFLFVNTSSRTIQKVSSDIAKVSEVIAVSQGMGIPDLFVNIRAKSLEHVHHIANTIGAIQGIKTVETNLCFRIHKFVSNIGA